MITTKIFRLILTFVSFAVFALHSDLSGQEKLTVSYSSVDAPSANYSLKISRLFIADSDVR